MTNKTINPNSHLSRVQKEGKPETRNYILYLDTSATQATIAIFEDSKKLAEEKWEGSRELSKTLSQKYQDILKSESLVSKGLAGICVFIGPGSFTGLRIGISFANGLAFALDIPIYETVEKEKFIVKNPKKLATPLYGAEPNITKPKKISRL